MRYFILIALYLFVSKPALACYNAEEAEAEQAIRIHSELMVIGLNCQHMTPRGQQNFYMQYKDITNRHRDLFSGYENTLISYYKKQGGNAERKMHDLRTQFANNVSTNAASMRPDIFCSRNVQRLRDVNRMSRNELQQWASTASIRQPTTQGLCN